MGSLILNKKLFSQVILKSYEEKYIRFKGPVGLSLINFIDPTYYSVFNTEYALNMYINGDINDPITFSTDGIDWYNSSASEIVNDYVVPINAVFRLKSDIVNYSAINLGQNANVNAMVENFSSGKTSIKKQILTKLKPINQFDDAVYVFRSATNNTLAQIFNPSIFALLDQIDIYKEGSLSGPSDSFLSTTSEWISPMDELNYDNYVIPNGSILVFTCNNPDLDIHVGGGAFIEKYYSGKLSLGKQNVTKLKPYAINNVITNTENIYIYKGGSINTIDTIFNKNEFTGGNNAFITADTFYIQEPNGTFKAFYYYDDGFNGDADPIQWQMVGSIADQSGYVIQPNSKIFMYPVTNKTFNVGVGAIINKFY